MLYSYIDEINLINEGFIVKDDTVYFDAESKEIIDTSFGKTKKLKPYQMKLPFGVMYSIYKASDSKEYNEVLKAIKGQSSKYKMDQESYDKFLTRSALYMSRIILQEEIDTIILMESSSKILIDLSMRLNKYLPKYYDTFTYDKGIFKNPDFSKIFIDIGDKDLDEKTLKDLKRTIDKLEREQYFSIKSFFARNRKFIKNWLKVEDKILSKIVDKNVAVIDDIVTSGSTIKEASWLLNESGATKVVGLSLIKGN